MHQKILSLYYKLNVALEAHDKIYLLMETLLKIKFMSC